MQGSDQGLGWRPSADVHDAGGDHRDADGFRPFGLLAGLGSAATRDREEVARLRGLIDRLLIRRSEERRVGEECVSTCSTRWWPDHSKKKTNRTRYEPCNQQ